METKTALRQQAEQYLGTAIEPSEWDSARASAEQKLARIIERYGDDGGARREPWYLAQLIAEAVNGSRFSQLTLDLTEISLLMEQEEAGVKKVRPTSENVNRTSTDPYCTTFAQQMQ